MDSRQLEQVIRLVVEEVLNATTSGSDSTEPSVGDGPFRGGDVLCIACDVSTGLDRVGQHLIDLQAGGVQFGLVHEGVSFPPIFGRVRFNDRLSDVQPPQFGSLLQCYDRLLVLNLSRRMAAQLATGAVMNCATELVLRALGKGIPVAAVTDPLDPLRIVCPEDPVRLDAVQQMIQRQLPILERLGIGLLPSEAVFETLAEQVQQDRKVDGMKPLQGFITLEDLEGFQGRSLRIVRGSRWTPLVEEWLSDNGVQVQIIDPPDGQSTKTEG